MDDELKRQKRTEARQRRISRKLAEIGMSADDFSQFKHLFTFSRWRWIRRVSEQMGWTTIERQFPLTDDAILDHLLKKNWVGTFCHPKTRVRVLIIDIDRHGSRGERTLRKRIEQVLKTFAPAEPFLIQSSASGGVHLIYLLDQPRSLEFVQRIARAVLESAGVVVKDGQVELYPSDSRGWRCPFGQDSFLLDEHLEPVAEGIGAIQHVLFEIRYEKREPLALPLSPPPVEEAPKSRSRPSKVKHALQVVEGALKFLPPDLAKFFVTPEPTSDLNERVREWLEDGLTDAGQRWRAHAALNVYWLGRFSPTVEDLRAAHTFFIEHYHHGRSKDWNEDPKKCLGEIERLVRWADAHRPTLRPKSSARSTQTPSKSERQRVELLAHGDGKYFLFLLNLVQTTKTFGIRNPETGEIVVALSKSLMETWPGCSRGGYIPPRDRAVSDGILKMVEDFKPPGPSGIGGRCRRYAVNFPFDVDGSVNTPSPRSNTDVNTPSPGSNVHQDV